MPCQEVNILQTLVKLARDLKELGKLVPNQPTTEKDLHNIIHIYLHSKGYYVEYKGKPGKRNTVDFIVENAIGIEAKHAKTSLDIDKVVGQAIRYKNNYRLDTVILLIYTANPHTKNTIKQKLLTLRKFLEKEQIIPIIVP